VTCHSRESDWARHGESEKHFPQQRYMCILCIGSLEDEHGSPLCSFCFSQISVSGNNKNHYLQCEQAQIGKHIFAGAREEHFRQHLKKHGLTTIGSEQATWNFPVDSGWSRECGFCGDRFSTWTERTAHIATHFRQGMDISVWRLPFGKAKVPLDYRPGISYHRRDEDGDDDDGDDSDSNDYDWGSGRISQNSMGFSSSASGTSHSDSTGHQSSESGMWLNMLNNEPRSYSSRLKVQNYLQYQLTVPVLRMAVGATGAEKSHFIRFAIEASNLEPRRGLKTGRLYSKKISRANVERDTQYIEVYEFLQDGQRITLLDIPRYDDIFKTDTMVLIDDSHTWGNIVGKSSRVQRFLNSQVPARKKINELASLRRISLQIQEAEKALGVNHPLTLPSMNILTEFPQQQGNYAEAEPLQPQTRVLTKSSLVTKADDTNSSDGEIEASNEYDLIVEAENVDGGSTKLRVSFDTQCPTNFIFKSALDKLGLVKAFPLPKTKTYGAFGQTVVPKEFARVTLWNHQIGLHSREKLKIVDIPGFEDGFQILIGRQTIRKLGGSKWLGVIERANAHNPKLPVVANRPIGLLRTWPKSQGKYLHFKGSELILKGV
jgi:hypothetical protein